MRSNRLAVALAYSTGLVSSPPKNKPWELYDLKTDRGETTDLAARHPDRVEKLAAAYQQWANRVGAANTIRDTRHRNPVLKRQSSF